MPHHLNTKLVPAFRCFAELPLYYVMNKAETMAQGVAQVLLEEIRYDEDGNLLTANFMDYLVPSAAEVPSYDLVHLETPTWVNPLGAKGVGESGTVGAIPAVYNAVVDALTPFGVTHLETPITPEKIWAALRG